MKNVKVNNMEILVIKMRDKSRMPVCACVCVGGGALVVEGGGGGPGVGLQDLCCRHMRAVYVSWWSCSCVVRRAQTLCSHVIYSVGVTQQHQLQIMHHLFNISLVVVPDYCWFWFWPKEFG